MIQAKLKPFPDAQFAKVEVLENFGGIFRQNDSANAQYFELKNNELVPLKNPNSNIKIKKQENPF